MIWFSCKQCGKTHGRPESSAGSMVFCDCGHGNLVPWESTAAEPAPLPEPPPTPLPPVARPAPTLPERDRPDRAGSPRSRRRARYAPDPTFCLNHENTPSQKTCADCGESFCNDCTVVFQGITLCGPCKNHRIRAFQKPPRLSSMAVISMLLAVTSGPMGLCLLWISSVVGSLFICFQVAALILGVLALRATERDPRISGRSLALTGILTAGLCAILTIVMAVFAPGFWS
jgi:hypothetical protein